MIKMRAEDIATVEEFDTLKDLGAIISSDSIMYQKKLESLQQKQDYETYLKKRHIRIGIDFQTMTPIYLEPVAFRITKNNQVQSGPLKGYFEIENVGMWPSNFCLVRD